MSKKSKPGTAKHAKSTDPRSSRGRVLRQQEPTMTAANKPNLLPHPQTPAHAIDRANAPTRRDPPPAGESGRELSSSEAAAALTGHVSTTIPATTTSAPAAAEVFGGKKPPKKTPCQNCNGSGAVVVGLGRNRCPVCNGAGELSV